MYQPEVYESLKKQCPESFAIAGQLYDNILVRNMLAVRALVTRARRNRMFEITQVEVVGLEYDYEYRPGTISRVLFRLSFRAEVDFQNNEIELLETSLEVSGPTYDGSFLGKEDILNHVGSFVVEWSEKKLEAVSGEEVISRPWSDPPVRPYVGWYVLSDNVCTSAPAHHHLILPSFLMCLGSFHGTFKEKLNDMQRSVDGEAREKALRSFKKRYDSFIAQARRENVRVYLGTFF